MKFSQDSSSGAAKCDNPFESKQNFLNIFKIVQKLGELRVLPYFWTILNLFGKMLFPLKGRVRLPQLRANSPIF